MAARKPAAPKPSPWPDDVCPECFPGGPTPPDATSVGCAHGTWTRSKEA